MKPVWKFPDSPGIKKQLVPVTDLYNHCLNLGNALQKVGAFSVDI